MQSKERLKQSLKNGSMLGYDFDGVKSFRDAFKHPVVFFVLPADKMVDQLKRVDSVVRLLQTSLASFPSMNETNTKVSSETVDVVIFTFNQYKEMILTQ